MKLFRLRNDCSHLGAFIVVASERTSMRFDWRTTAGPALAAATALTAILIDRHVVGVPNPAPLLVCIVAFAGSLSGIRSAAVSAAIAIVGSAVFFLDHRAVPGYDTTDLVRRSTLAIHAG